MTHWLQLPNTNTNPDDFWILDDFVKTTKGFSTLTVNHFFPEYGYECWRWNLFPKCRTRSFADKSDLDCTWSTHNLKIIKKSSIPRNIIMYCVAEGKLYNFHYLKFQKWFHCHLYIFHHKIHALFNIFRSWKLGKLFVAQRWKL